ncbi:ANFY1 protein, partial [Polypterus senegalus]
MQQKLADTEKRCAMLEAQANQESTSESFISRLLSIVADLYQQEQYRLESVVVADTRPEVAMAMLRWVYTDKLELKEDDVFLTDLMKLANRFQLQLLRERCEKGVMSLVNVRNCIRFYQTAEELSATTLVNYCAEIIASHWDDLRKDDFSTMSAQLLYKMIKSKTDFPLHKAIKVEREDVVFLYLIEMDSQLPSKLNELDRNGDLALDLALSRKLESIATTLVNNKADVDMIDHNGWSLLHKAVQRGDEFASTFLIRNSSKVNAATATSLETPLHLASSFSPKKHSPQFITVSTDQSVNPFDDVPVMNGTSFDENSFAARLIKRGSNPDAPDTMTGNCLLQRAAEVGNEAAALFLATHGVKVNHTNNWGESPLHTACRLGLANLTSELLQQGANPNLQTMQPLPDGHGVSSAQGVYLQSPLHMAIAYNHPDVVSVILEQKGMHTIAAQLLGSGASINDTMSNGQTLLHMAILRQDSQSALFLLEHQADINMRTQDGETALQLAIRNQLPLVVDAICTRGADMSVLDEKGNPPLWLALDRGLEDIASTLVRHGCDATSWTPGPSGCLQTLLHRAIDENNESIACFLIRSGCDLNSPRRPGPNGEGDEEAHDGQTPLHLAASWGLEEVVQCLLEFGANVNTQASIIHSVQANVNSRVQDASKLSPLHLAVQAGSEIIVRNLLLAGAKVNELTKHRQTALHLAAQQDLSTICSVLLENGVDFAAVDENGNNALHLAVMHGRLNNIRVLLTESNVDAEAFNLRGQSPMHILGQYGKENAAAIFELFLECMPEYPLDKPDNEGNTDMLTKEPPWCDGSNCYECSAKFGVTTRKHHCRHCGRLLCHKCSMKEIPVIKFDLNKPVRVCDICFDVLTLGGVS